jgi:hypothetical protein
MQKLRLFRASKQKDPKKEREQALQMSVGLSFLSYLGFQSRAIAGILHRERGDAKAS